MRDEGFLLALVVIVLLGAAILLPENSLTGHVVLESNSCSSKGCGMLCDVDNASSCPSGNVCCPSAWENGTVGICGAPDSCEEIALFSLEQPLEEYVVVANEVGRLSDLGWWTFYFPLLVIVAFCGFLFWVWRK